jgi:hypothetical protein
MKMVFNKKFQIPILQLGFGIFIVIEIAIVIAVS